MMDLVALAQDNGWSERYAAGDIDEHEFRERLAVLKENR